MAGGKRVTKKRGTKIPRASLSVSILDDEDYIAMMDLGADGQVAFAAFAALIIAAKSRRNGGIFRAPIKTIASLVRWDAAQLTIAIATIQAVVKKNKNRPWLATNAEKLTIRNFDKWNEYDGWGGNRDGSGRKSSCNQDDSAVSNQDDSSLQVDTDTDTDTESVSSGSEGGAEETKPKPKKKARAPCPIWDAVAGRWYGGNVIESQRTAVGKIVKDLKELGATSDEITTRADRISRAWGSDKSTPRSVVNHWGQFATEPTAGGSPHSGNRGNSTPAGANQTQAQQRRAVRRGRDFAEPDDPIPNPLA